MNSLKMDRKKKLDLLWKKIATASKEEAEYIINQLDEKTLNELYTNKNIFNKPINPEEENEKIALFSYVNMPRKYLTKLLMTAQVGFLYQMAIEFTHKSAESLPSRNEGELGNMIYKVREEFRLNKPVQLYKQKLDKLEKKKKDIENKINCLTNKNKDNIKNNEDNIKNNENNIDEDNIKNDINMFAEEMDELKKIKKAITKNKILYKKALIKRYKDVTKSEKPKYDNYKTDIKNTTKMIAAIKKKIKALSKEYNESSSIKPENRGKLKDPEEIKKEIADYKSRLKKGKEKLEEQNNKLIAYEKKLNTRDAEIEKLENEIKKISAAEQCLIPDLPKIEVDDEDEIALTQFCKKKLNITQTREDRVEEIQDYILDFLDYHFKYDPNNHIHQGYMPHYEEKLRKKLNKLPRHKSGMVITENFAEFLVPPADTFEAFRHYFDTNYEYLRQAADDIYGDLSPYENMIIFHKDFDGPDASKKAKEWKLKHRELVDLDVYETKYHRWTLMDSWRKNRDNIDVYNRDTRLIEEIMENCKKEERMAGELLKKRARKGKRKTEGIDDFDKRYPSKVTEYGVKKIDGLEVPRDTGKLGDDEVKINVINTGARRRGRRMVPAVSRWKFHLPAEKPEDKLKVFRPGQKELEEKNK